MIDVGSFLFPMYIPIPTICRPRARGGRSRYVPKQLMGASPQKKKKIRETEKFNTVE